MSGTGSSGAAAARSAGDALAAAYGLADKLVFVTGSTAGIGKATAHAFAAAGARVIVNGRKKETVDAVVAELNGAGLPGQALGVTGDVSSAAGANEVAAAVDAIGPLDVLVNNTGIFAVSDFFETSDDEWQRFFDTNVMSSVRLSRHFLRGMLSRNAGRIVMVSSEAGARGFATMAHYALTKAAQINLSRSLALLTRGTGVTVNSVLPGPTMTEGVREFLKGAAAQKGVTVAQAEADYFSGMEGENTSLLQRFLKPEEVANVIVFTASQAASGINGASQRVEGGLINVP